MNKEEFETIKKTCDDLEKKYGHILSLEDALKKIERYVGEGATEVELQNFPLKLSSQAFKDFLILYKGNEEKEYDNIAKKIKIT